MARRPPKPADRIAQPRHKAKGGKSASSAVDAAKRLTDQEATLDDIEMKQYFEADDRSFAILRGANVENALEIAIAKHLVIHEGENRNLLRSDGPLGTFSRKITMGYALGFFGPITKENLEIIRHIRNTFAHAKRHVDFATKEIDDLCKHFRLPSLKVNPRIECEDDPEHAATSDRPARNTYHTATFITEISLIRLCNRITGETIKSLGGRRTEPKQPRVLFDDSLP